MELGDGTLIPILYEDRSVLAIDKPPGWMLVPYSWQRTNRNLQAAIVSAIAEGHFWARSRNLKFLRYVHRLDAETSGILLFAKSPGAVESFGDLFESRRMTKIYLCVVTGSPSQAEWTCRDAIAPDSRQIGRMRIDRREGKDAETHFKVLQSKEGKTLVEASPVTGRTHQIRVHLEAGGHPIVGDPMYGTRGPVQPAKGRRGPPEPMGLRAVFLSYPDPFTRKEVDIEAPADAFLKSYGFKPEPQARQ